MDWAVVVEHTYLLAFSFSPNGNIKPSHTHQIANGGSLHVMHQLWEDENESRWVGGGHPMFTASLSESLDVAEWLDYRLRSAGKEFIFLDIWTQKQNSVN